MMTSRELRIFRYLFGINRDTKDVGTFVKNYSKDSKVFILIWKKNKLMAFKQVHKLTSWLFYIASTEDRKEFLKDENI